MLTQTQTQTSSVNIPLRGPTPDFYRPQTKLRKGNVFTSVCQEFCPQRGKVYTPLADTPWADTPPPNQTASATDGTHPTGMHSC